MRRPTDRDEGVAEVERERRHPLQAAGPDHPRRAVLAGQISRYGQ